MDHFVMCCKQVYKNRDANFSCCEGSFSIAQRMPNQVIPGHGNPKRRRTMFIRYLFKYYSLNY